MSRYLRLFVGAIALGACSSTTCLGKLMGQDEFAAAMSTAGVPG
jgi:hypothetical protein